MNVRLCSNENALGTGLAARRAVSSMDLDLYPDPSMQPLRERLAALHGTTAAEVCVGAGATDLIFHLVASLALGGEVLAPRHTFVGWRLAARCVGVDYVEGGGGLRTDLEALEAAVTPRTRLVCVVNPANPTGYVLDPEALRGLLQRLPSNLPVVVDEAYAEFATGHRPCTGPQLRKSFDNLIVLRTFSKAYGLAGLRVGYALGHPDCLQRVEARRPPFSVSALAQGAALAALDDKRHLVASVQHNHVERARLSAVLTKQGLKVLPSGGNFLCVRVGDGAEVTRRLLERGVAVSALAAYGLPAWVRVTVGTRPQNEAFVEALLEVEEARGRSFRPVDAHLAAVAVAGPQDHV